MPVSADYFRVLGVHPVLGQVFARADERAERTPRCRQRADLAQVSGRRRRRGRTARCDQRRTPYRVVAVLPDGFDDPLESGVDVWVPLNLQPGGPNSFDNYYLSAIARLKPGATRGAGAGRARNDGGGDADRATRRRTSRWSARVVPLQTDTVGSAGPMLWILLGAVGLLLIIACVNVASLFLARGAARETELAVRAALGCSGWRLVRQLLVESVLLSLTGGVAGLLLARVVSGTLLAAAPAAVARVGSEALERSVLAFSFGVAVLAGIALRRRTGDPGDPARPRRDAARIGAKQQRQPPPDARAQRAGRLSGGAGPGPARSAPACLLRTFERLRSVDLGVRTSHVLTFAVQSADGTLR